MTWYRRVACNLKRHADFISGILIASGVLCLYLRSLVPSFLDGDPGHFEYISAALGIPYPPGFPLYVLLSYIWSLVPVGTVAYRINLFSAVFGALTAGALFIVLRQQNVHRLASVGGALSLALLPPFWQYSTFAAEYTLHTFLVVLLFGLLAKWEITRREMWLRLAMLVIGLGLSNHPTFLLLVPATVIFIIAVAGRSVLERPRAYLQTMSLAVLPCAIYLYLPIRANQLLTDSPVAVAQGIVSQFYQNSPTGIFSYLTASTFVKGIAGQWKWDTLALDWWMAISPALNWQILLACLPGAFWLARRSSGKLLTWLCLVIVTFGLVTLQYSYSALSNVSDITPYLIKFFLPGFIVLVILASWGVEWLLQVVHSAFGRGRVASLLASVTLASIIFIPSWTNLMSRHSTRWIEQSAELNWKWRTVQIYPPRQDAAVVGHWGDLTPLWYLQTAEGWRRDLVAIFPPTDEAVNVWLATGKPLYLAGSLLEWAPGIAERYHLTPWGPLVQVTSQVYTPASPLSHSTNQTFIENEPQLDLVGYDVLCDIVHVGEVLDVALYWKPLTSIPLEDYVVSLSLDDQTAVQNFPIVVNWLPGGKLKAGQRALGVHRFLVPWGTRAGTYQLRLTVYSLRTGKTLGVSGGQTSIELAAVRVEPAASYPDRVRVDHSASADFGHRVSLLGWDGDLKELMTGSPAAVQLLWKGAREPVGNLTAQLSLEDLRGARPVGEQILGKDYPPDRWSPGEIVRDSQPFTIPADVPDGDYVLVLRVLDSSGSRLPLFDSWFPRGDNLTLAQIHIKGRPHSYTVPDIPHLESANFGDRIALLGYASEQLPDNVLRITLYWRTLVVMQDSYTVFVHVTDSQSRIIAQRDSIPGAGTLPTTGWLPDEIITDSLDLTLPSEISANSYQVQLGLYNAVTGERLNIINSDQDYAILR